MNNSPITLLSTLLDRREKLGSIGALDFLIEREAQRLEVTRTYKIGYTPFECREVELPGGMDAYRQPPKNFPNDLVLPEITGLGNDYFHLLSRIRERVDTPVSIVVLTFNRAEALRRTLAGILRQSYPRELLEVIVTDDGGTEDTLFVVKEFSKYLNVKYVWHKDVGFTPASARNNAVGVARNDFIILLDVDMFPGRDLVKNYVRYADILDDAVLIGPRKYVDINDIDSKQILNDSKFEENLREIVTNNDVAGRKLGNVSVDWRLEVFEKTRNLRDENVPFRAFASGNVAFSRRKFESIGRFNESFVTWGFEDTELGFRFFNEGLYMVPVLDALAFHQEPVGGINETNRLAGKEVSGELFGDLCPYYRALTKKKSDYTVPRVSIYIPAYNARTTICDAVDSALRQTYEDLEVCICDDGSSDGTSQLLAKYFGRNPRVRWVTKKNGGIGSASNSALSLCRGIYVGQLDSDDYLADDVVERCINVLDANLKTGLVYTTYENEYPDGRIEPGYNYPLFTREKMLTASIVHHFRMFRKLYWCRTTGFNERLKNAVDYDMYLKLTEVCQAVHLNVVGYRRRLHGRNTSIVDSHTQIVNTKVVVNDALNRMKLKYRVDLESESSTKLVFSDPDS